MVRRVRIRSVVFGIAVLIVAHSFLEVRNPAFGQDVSKDAKAALKERDRLWEQTQKLRAAGKLAEAIAAAEAMLAIERKVLPEDDADLAVSLGWLAMTPCRARGLRGGEGGPARGPGHPAEATGESDWRVVDARRALEDVERRAGMDRDQRHSLAEAERLNRTVLDLYGPASTPRPFPGASGPGDPQGGAGRAPPRQRHQPEQPGGYLLDCRGTTPPPSPSTSRPWRSARRCWASTTPTTPPA